MPTPDCQNLEPLIAEQDQQGSNVEVTFRCPTTGVEAKATAAIRPSKSVQATAERSVKKKVWGGLRRAVTSAISSSLGSGTAGRIAREVANNALGSQASGASFTKDEIRAAVVDAFVTVQSQFRWDVKRERWVGAKAPENAFVKQLAAAPIAEKCDRAVLARALVELCCADGKVTETERDFVGDFIDPEIGAIDELASREKLSSAELAETTAAVRDSVLMLSWACALSDEDLAEEEKSRLEEIASGLGIAAERAEELERFAQEFLFEQALNWAYPGGQRDDQAYAEVLASGLRLGLSSEEAEKVDIAFRKQHGIV